MPRRPGSIPTSHVGTLPRPDALDALCLRFDRPSDDAAFTALVPEVVAAVVRRQADLGIAIVNDGELGKRGGFSYYAQTRLGGVETRDTGPVPAARSIVLRDRLEFPGYYEMLQQRAALLSQVRQRVALNTPVFCTSALTYVGQRDAQFDIDTLLAATEGLDVQPFMTAVAPGTIEHWLWNEHYGTDEEFLFAIADAMHEEYAMIAGAGILLQIDDPDLPDGWQMFPDITVDRYRSYATLRVEALNHALRGIPEEMVRLHVCWGSGHGPHKNDIPLRDIVDLVLRVRVGCYSLEAANPRHEHEWEVWRDVRLPEGRTLMPGVVGHASDTIEHPELVAQRIVRFAGLVGREHVVAGTDCGLGSRVGHPEIAWAKLQSLVEGAALATERLQRS